MATTFGSALRALRRSKGVSQRDLAARIGVDFSYISKLENDRLPAPSADTVVRMAAALDEPSEALLALTGKLPSDLRDAVASSPSALAILRRAKSMELSSEEWEEMSVQLKRLRG